MFGKSSVDIAHFKIECAVEIDLSVFSSSDPFICNRCYKALKLSRTMAYTTRNTVNRLARKQLHLNHVVSERTKGGINLYIKLEKHLSSMKHKLDET